MNGRRAGLLVALACALAPAARAHIVSAREVRVFQQLPRAESERLLRAGRPDSSGAAGANRRAWRHVADQQGSLAELMRATATGDTTAAEDAWRAIELAFQHQRPDAGFERAPGVTGAALGLAPAAGAEDPAALEGAAEALFLGELCRTLVAVENGPLRDRFHWRVVLVLPKLRRSLDSLAVIAERLERSGAGSAGWMLACAQSFTLGDGLYHVERFGFLGQRFFSRALALQDSTGRFADRGLPPLAAQTRALVRLQSLALYYPAPSVERAEARGIESLLRRMPRGPAAAFGARAAGLPPDAGPERAMFVLLHNAGRAERPDLARRVSAWLAPPARSRADAD